jgi:hypothetical protein
MIMADRTIESFMRDALKNAETGSQFINKAPILGSSLETVIFATAKGNKKLCAIGIETALAVTASAWGVADAVAVAPKQGQMIDDLMVKIDNQLRVKSSHAPALLEWSDIVLDKVQSDTILTANGTARSYHLIPVSGVGGRMAQLDIDFASFASMYVQLDGGETITEGAKQIVITPYYTDMPIPQFSFISGSTPGTGTGMYKLQVSGDFLGNGFLSEGILIGDGTIVGDDLRIIQEDGKLLLNQKCYLRASTGTRPLEAYWQNLRQKTVLTNSAGFYVSSTLPWTINSSIELDVSTTGTFAYGLLFKNSPTVSNDAVVGEPRTLRPESSSQPQAVPTVTNTRQNVVTLQGVGQNISGNLKRLFK